MSTAKESPRESPLANAEGIKQPKLDYLFASTYGLPRFLLRSPDSTNLAYPTHGHASTIKLWLRSLIFLLSNPFKRPVQAFSSSLWF